MVKLTDGILKQIGFKYEKFPDGYFFHLYPQGDADKLKLALLMGFSDYDECDPPDTVILQCDTEFKNWQYVCDGDYGALCEREALEIVEVLNGEHQ